MLVFSVQSSFPIARNGGDAPTVVFRGSRKRERKRHRFSLSLTLSLSLSKSALNAHTHTMHKG